MRSTKLPPSFIGDLAIVFSGIILFCGLLVALSGCEQPARAANITPPKNGKVQSPKAAASADALNSPMAALVTTNGPQVVMLGANFAPCANLIPTARIVLNFGTPQAVTNSITNAVAYIDVATNLTAPIAWKRFALAYPPAGGTMVVPWTNYGSVFWRAGYQYSAAPANSF